MLSRLGYGFGLIRRRRRVVFPFCILKRIESRERYLLAKETKIRARITYLLFACEFPLMSPLNLLELPWVIVVPLLIVSRYPAARPHPGIRCVSPLVGKGRESYDEEQTPEH